MANHLYGLKKSRLDGTEKVFEHKKYMAMKLPTTYDLRPDCPPVYDQGQENSCTANAGAACRIMLAKNPELQLSRAFLYYNERLLEGDVTEDNGASMKDIGDATQQYGICPEADMPYAEGSYKQAPSAAASKDAEQYKISGAKMVTADIDAIKTALFARQQPTLVGMTVYASMESEQVAKTGVLPMPSRYDQALGGHAVLAVGWLLELPEAVKDALQKLRQDSKKSCIKNIINSIFGRNVEPSGYLIVRNSWGDQWGDKGYFYMPYEYVTENYADEFWIMEE